MRTKYTYNDADYLRTFQTGGGGVPFMFSGARRQGGGGLLGSAFKFISRYAIPVIKHAVIPTAKTLARTYTDVKDGKMQWENALKQNAIKSFSGKGLTDIKSGRNKRSAAVGFLPPLEAGRSKKKKKTSVKRTKRTDYIWPQV